MYRSSHRQNAAICKALLSRHNTWHEPRRARSYTAQRKEMSSAVIKDASVRNCIELDNVDLPVDLVTIMAAVAPSMRMR